MFDQPTRHGAAVRGEREKQKRVQTFTDRFSTAEDFGPRSAQVLCSSALY